MSQAKSRSTPRRRQRRAARAPFSRCRWSLTAASPACSWLVIALAARSRPRRHGWRRPSPITPPWRSRTRASTKRPSGADTSRGGRTALDVSRRGQPRAGVVARLGDHAGSGGPFGRAGARRSVHGRCPRGARGHPQARRRLHRSRQRRARSRAARPRVDRPRRPQPGQGPAHGEVGVPFARDRRRPRRDRHRCRASRRASRAGAAVDHGGTAERAGPAARRHHVLLGGIGPPLRRSRPGLCRGPGRSRGPGHRQRAALSHGPGGQPGQGRVPRHGLARSSMSLASSPACCA